MYGDVIIPFNDHSGSETEAEGVDGVIWNKMSKCMRSLPTSVTKKDVKR